MTYTSHPSCPYPGCGMGVELNFTVNPPNGLYIVQQSHLPTCCTRGLPLIVHFSRRGRFTGLVSVPDDSDV